MRKLPFGAMLLVLALSTRAQSTVTETLGVGAYTNITDCKQDNPCTAPVLVNGELDGNIVIYPISGQLQRHNQDGSTRWTSSDFNLSTSYYSHNGLPGTFQYATESKVITVYRCGNSSYRAQTCRYVYVRVASGSLTE